jgi:TIR domain
MSKLKIFCSYAPKDKNLMEAFTAHLRGLESQHVSVWYAHNILPGTEWERERDSQLHSAHIILFLVSSDFISSHEQYEKEVLPAMEQHNRGETHVIPIILRPVYWKEAPFSKLLPLPDDGRPVTDLKWSSKDQAFLNVILGIKRIIDDNKMLRPREEWNQDSLSPKPTNIRFTYQPSWNGNKGIILFQLKEKEHTLEYFRNDKITHQVFLLKQRQLELVKLVVPFATLQSLEKRLDFQIDGVDCLFTLKMSAITSIMSVKLEIGGEEVFRT